MIYHLESPYLQFSLNIQKATWSLYGKSLDSPFLEDVRMSVNYRMGVSALLRSGKRNFRILEKWLKPQVKETESISSPHGPLRQVIVETAPDINGISCQIVFALAEQHPLFLWQVTIRNQGRRPVDIERINLLRAGSSQAKDRRSRQAPIGPGYLAITQEIPPPKPGSVIRPNPNPGKLAFFSNGWQTWSYTATYSEEDVYRATRFGLIEAQRWYASGKSPKRIPGLFISDMFGVLGDLQHRSGILAGFLAQKQHFSSLEAKISDPFNPVLNMWANGDRARLDPGAQIPTDWAAIQFVEIDSPDPLAPYLDAVARENALTPHPLPIFHREMGVRVQTGWCSWYHFFQNIDEEKMRANLKSAVELRDTVPLDLFQIDDGFQAEVGDWLEFSSGFHQGVDHLASEIKKAGLIPGLWLAPFIVHSKSKLASEHREFLLRNRLGFRVHAGFQWNNLAKALDLTHPEALNYVREIVKTAVHEWGFRYLKLDFLYAAGLKGRYRDRTKTRAQVLRMGLEALREAVGPGVTLLGCGCPIGTGVGIFDAMRIGADVSPRWKPDFSGIEGPFNNEPNMPSTRNALQNILTRAPFHNRWWVNDPDCLLIRPDSQLTLPEIQSLATAIALSGGSLLLSDDLTNLPADRLHIARQLLPIIGRRPRVLDWFDAPTPRLMRLDLENAAGKWHLLAVFNWDEDEGDLSLPLEKLDLEPGEYFTREFWTGESHWISGGLLALKNIPAHGVKLLSLTPISSADELKYIGSNLHVSQGLEVTRWSVMPPNGVRFSLERPGESQGEVELYLPAEPSRIQVNHQEVEWQSLGDGRCRFAVQFRQSAEIEVH